MTMDIFGHNNYVNQIIEDLKLSNEDINKIKQKYVNYPIMYNIPFIIYASPQPYKPLRINFKTGRFYVPNKKKLVTEIQKLVFSQIPSEHINMYFPIFTETMFKVAFYIPTPSSFSKEDKYLGECKILRPIVTPDIDNVEKIIFDSLKDGIVYDDAQVISNITEKYYSMTPRIEVLIVYNGVPTNNVHKKLIASRKIRWETKVLANPRFMKTLQN